MRLWLVPMMLAAGSSLCAAQVADSPACKLFTPKEASAYVGASLGAGESSFMPGAVGCAWSDDAAGAKLDINVLPAGNALQLKRWGFESFDGFRAVPDIGARAYVARSPVMEIAGQKYGGGWQAGAIVGSDYVAVGLKGPKANADTAVAFLKDVIKRRQR